MLLHTHHIHYISKLESFARLSEMATWSKRNCHIFEMSVYNSDINRYNTAPHTYSASRFWGSLHNTPWFHPGIWVACIKVPIKRDLEKRILYEFNTKFQHLYIQPVYILWKIFKRACITSCRFLGEPQVGCCWKYFDEPEILLDIKNWQVHKWYRYATTNEQWRDQQQSASVYALTIFIAKYICTS